ncbi:hypothetical protein K435DRAFT_877860, partial [Dendrothele bispora CBS 962.96]
MMLTPGQTVVVEAKPNQVTSSTTSQTPVRGQVRSTAPFLPVASSITPKTPVRGQVQSTTPSLSPTKAYRKLTHSPAPQSPIQRPNIGTSFGKLAPIVLSDSDDSDSEAVGKKEDQEDHELWKHFGNIDEDLMVINDPGEFLPPAYIYTGFARLAHPDELPWDGRRGTKDIYVVTRGRRVGIFADWVLVEDLAKGVRDAYFRKCDSVDEAVALYTAAYNQLPGHKKLEVVPVGPSVDNPIVDDRSSLIRGQDVDIVVREVPTLTFHVVPA